VDQRGALDRLIASLQPMPRQIHALRIEYCVP